MLKVERRETFTNGFLLAPEKRFHRRFAVFGLKNDPLFVPDIETKRTLKLNEHLVVVFAKMVFHSILVGQFLSVLSGEQELTLGIISFETVFFILDNHLNEFVNGTVVSAWRKIHRDLVRVGVLFVLSHLKIRVECYDDFLGSWCFELTGLC